MPNPKRLEALAQAYDEQVHAVRARLEAFGKAYWESMPNYRETALEGMLNALIPRVKAGQIQTAEITRAYLQAFAEENGWADHTPPVDIEEVTSQRGVDPKEVYSRPVVTARAALGEGKSLAEASKAGGLRLLQLIGGDMQLAKRAQAQRSMEAAGVEAYRRKLTGRENCALCVIASTQRYWVKDLLPIHPGCDCNVEPLPPHLAGEHVIDEETLEAAHAAVEQELGVSARDGRAVDYRELILTTEHGEYGPVISWKETKANRRVRLKYGDVEFSGQFEDYAFTTLGEVATGKVSREAIKLGIRPYRTLEDVPRISPESPQEALPKVNKHFWHEMSKFARRAYDLPPFPNQINCTRCALAYEMRRRGFDLVAGSGQYEPRGNWFDTIALSWRDQRGHIPRWKGERTTNRLVKLMEEKEPPGARGMVVVVWEGEPERGHAFNWERVGNKVVFYDSQTASTEEYDKVIDIFDWDPLIRRGSMSYIRLDDCEPKDRVLNQISTEVE